MKIAKLTPAQREANQRESQKKYALTQDSIRLRFAKGCKERIKKYAASRNESINKYVFNLIKSDMSEHGYSIYIDYDSYDENIRTTKRKNKKK